MSSPEDQLSKICAEINEIEIKMADIAYKKARRIVEVEKVISKLSEEEYKTVLTLCYIDHMAISDIADKLGYSSDWVYKKRRKATDELERFI
jgi:DNA-directed RNA polymerase specialized sigma24 family protein